MHPSNPCQQIFLRAAVLAVGGGIGMASAQPSENSAIEKPAKQGVSAENLKVGGVKPTHPATEEPMAPAGEEGAAAKQGSNKDAVGNDLERQEREMTVEAMRRRMQDLEREVGSLKAKTETLGESLAAASAEAAQYKEDYGRMRLQMEALGIAALSGNERSLQLRLLNAVNDYRLAEKEKQQLAEKLVHLSEASLAFMKSADAPNRERLEATLREANNRLHATSDQSKAVPLPLDAAKVVSYKPDLGLAVINAGRDSGLRLGMPLRITRKDHPVASGVIVDCRDQLTGILITTLDKESDPVAVGDAIKLEPTKPSAN